MLRALEPGSGSGVVSLTWSGDALVEATLRLPDGATIVVRPGADAHPLLGPCDGIHLVADGAHHVDADGEIGPAIARVASVSWARPTCIPAVDVPGALPVGAGSAILNLLATLAAHAGVPSLRYRGPYPTAALFESLLKSFRADADAGPRFVADPEGRFGSVELSPSVEFVPAPFRWSWTGPRICAQHRDGLERLWIDGRAYDRSGEHHVLVDDGDDRCAQVIFAGAPWCEVLRVDADGVPRGPIAAPPVVPEDLLGVALPRAMIEVVAEGLARESAPALGPAIHRVLAAGITLADTGLAPSRGDPSGIVVHAALVERGLALAPAASLRVVLDAVRGPVVRAAVADLARELALHLRGDLTGAPGDFTNDSR
jgi:hypothetical protein